MSTWQMFPDAENGYRWEVCGSVLRDEDGRARTNQQDSSPHLLSSMSDLLRQGCWKLLEREEGSGNGPMFRTGSGKTVSVKQFSIDKAKSVLGAVDSNPKAVVSGEASARGNSFGCSNSLFQTGSGKSVSVSAAGLIRARSLLGMEEGKEYASSRGFQQPRKAFPSNEGHWLQNSLMEGVQSNGCVDNGFRVPKPSFDFSGGGAKTKIMDQVSPSLLPPDKPKNPVGPPAIKFQTAGGRSLSVSSAALQHARSLLGDPDLGAFLNDTDISACQDSRCDDLSSIKDEKSYSAFTYPVTAKGKVSSKTFISPLKSSSNQFWSSFNQENVIVGTNLMNKFDAAENGAACKFDSISSLLQPLCNGHRAPNIELNNDLVHGKPKIEIPIGLSREPFGDISNTIMTSHLDSKQNSGEKRRAGRGSSVTPFKKPRNSKFTAPLNKEVTFVTGLCGSSESFQRRTVSTRYPICATRMYIKEYFAVPSLGKNELENFKVNSRCLNSENAYQYMFSTGTGSNPFGVDAFQNLLVQFGASSQYASKEWIKNHYRWIVWKLASYERRFPAKPPAKFFTVSNVLEELKYRYEREANYGHRSAIKRILEGDAPSSAMMVLCISAVFLSGEKEFESHPALLSGSGGGNTAKMELTDGWYSVNAVLDAPLLKHLASGKLFVGQKLRIWGAGLHGWAGPVSPLEAFGMVSLLLQINGTYRAHWADRLGFCKDVGLPLAFRCIKSDGGPVPRTLIGVTRIYPVLYKEKLSAGGAVVRSERMEAKMVQLHNQRCSSLIEGVVSEYQRGSKGSNSYNDSDGEEGAKIFKILEKSAEPEILMAEMSTKQLTSFASYQAKLETIKQLDMEKAIEKALGDAALGERNVTPFMRVRVVGLTGYRGKGLPKEGLITVWNPTEKQQNDLVEGQAYVVEGLLPVSSNSNTLYLQARGSTTKWQDLSSQAIKSFQPFFNPRVSTLLSNLGEVSLCSEFDVSAFVLHVGEVHLVAHQKKQWVFVTDGSMPMLQSEDTPNSLLAISFCSPSVDSDSFVPMNYNLAGSVVGFCNLIKRAKDPSNHLWIAEATENSTYYLSFDSPKCSHLKMAAASAQSWTKTSSLILGKLKQKVSLIIGDQEAKLGDCF